MYRQQNTCHELVSQAGKQQPIDLLKSVQFRTKHPLTFA